MGNCFYKYRQLAARENSTEIHPFTLSIIQKGEMWFSSPVNFNDPFDGMINYPDEMTMTDLEKFCKRMSGLGLDTQGVLNGYNKSPRQLSMVYSVVKQKLMQDSKLKIYCLSRNPLDSLMWAHYAASHTGICIGFKTYQLDERAFGIKVHENCVSSKLLEPDVSNILIPIPVTYTSKVPGKYDFGRGTSEALQEAFLNKAIEWQYEQECRIVTTDDTLLENPVRIDVNEIEELIFGLRASPLLVEQVKDIVSKSPYKQPGPKLYQCQRIPGTYALEKVLLSL